LSSGLKPLAGFKEFQAYLAAEYQPQALFDVAVDLMKQATRKYAAYQVKWIRKRLLPAVNAIQTTGPTSVYSYVLDTSGMSFPCCILRKLSQKRRCRQLAGYLEFNYDGHGS